jgi:hypothetical protein
MQDHRFLCLSVALLVPMVAPAQSSREEMEPQFPQQQTAGQLLTTCASSRLTSTGRERRRYCAGFVSGVEETYRLLDADAAEKHFCVPPDISASALADAYVRYGAGHQGELDDTAAEVVLHALEAAYPCGRAP